MPSRQDLPSKLAKARHELEKAQAHVADLEAQLFENQPISSTLLNRDDRYHRLLDSLLEGAELIGFDWRYLYVNDTVAGHGRQSKEVLLRSTVLELYPGIENTEMFALLRKCMEERTTQHFETEFAFPDGTLAWFELSVQPVPEGIFILSLEITERKRAEVALQESYHTLERRVNERTAELQAAKERVEAILNNSTDGILLIDTDLKIQQTNASFNSLFGCEWDEYFGKSLVTLIFAEDADKVTKLIQTIVAEPHRKRIEIRALRKDGKVFDAELSIGLIKDDGLVGSIYDITERKAQERQLRYHANIQASMSDAVIATDMDFCIQSWNRAAEAIYGWSAAEAIGKPVNEIVQTTYESEADRTRNLHDFLERGAWQGEVIQRHRDGSPINILASVNLFRDDMGQPFGVVSVNRDITERKRANDALSESENRFRRAIIDAPFPIMIHADDGEILHISNAWTEISGYTHNDIPTMTDWVDKAYRENSQVVRAVIDKLYSLTGTQRNGEFRIWTKSGEERIWDFVSAPLALMPDGRRMVSSMAMDITERKAQERQLRFYASIQESVTDAVVATDLKFRIQSWNRAAEQMYGWHAEEVIGKVSGEILQTQFLSVETREQAVQMLHEQGHFVGEAIQRHKDGRTIYVFGSVMLIKDETRLPIGFVAVNHDITKNKQAEEALQLALVKEKELGDLKTRFVSMASHEFRNPLATILATTDTLSAYRHKLTEEQIEQRFDKIKEQVGHLKDIMEDVLLLARMQARRVEFNPVKLDLDALVRSVLDEFESRTDIRHKLEYTVGKGSHEVVLDRKLIRQIISNLVSNAIKYSPEDKVVRIHLEYSDGEVILKISDEGIGIPEADLPHLFEPFHRATNVGTISGTGLGLVITREAAELHGGTITVESQQGVGTTFTIRIPISIGG